MSGLDFCGLALAHRVINASGTFDAIAARRAFGDQVVERFPFAAYVTKTDKPLIVKLTPNAGDVAAVARAVEAAGANALSLINTIRGMALAPGSSEPWLGGGTGGVSGPAVRAVALAQVHSVCSAVGVPII